MSLVSLGWQVYTWRQRRRPAALVLLDQIHNAGPRVDDYTGEPIAGSWHETFRIDVTAVNRGDVTFEVADVGLAHPSGDPAAWAMGDPARRAPPGESVRESFDVSGMPDHWLEGPVVGMVRLVSGETFTSGEAARRLSPSTRRSPRFAGIFTTLHAVA